MEYPTRIEAQERYDFASKHKLVLERVKYKQFLNIHDALDAKDAALDKVSESYLSTYGKLEETQAELDKAKDLIKRMLNSYNAVGTDEFDELFDEAGAMTKE